MTKKQDLRVLRTHTAIYRAFYNLLSIKDYTGITIQDIADEAMINRSTFMPTFMTRMIWLKRSSNKKLESIQAIMKL
ncbi:MAG: TetR/AcrR family transcriptional regulator, partial [Alkalibacterium thalassium]|nr:TetR/AcrR family transcriptional regulator [Alkalibacterium thalassium]